MTPAELQAWADAIKNAFLGGALVAVVVGGLRQWYVWGWLYKDVVKDRDEWKGMALDGIKVAHRSAVVAEVAARTTS